jgi:hypothetical protein
MRRHGTDASGRKQNLIREDSDDDAEALFKGLSYEHGQFLCALIPAALGYNFRRVGRAAHHE